MWRKQDNFNQFFFKFMFFTYLSVSNSFSLLLSYIIINFKFIFNFVSQTEGFEGEVSILTSLSQNSC